MTQTTTTALRHPALALRDAVNTITTELVRADIAPGGISVQPNSRGGEPLVSMQLTSRAAFDSARTLFDLDLVSTYEADGGEVRICGSGRFMGMFVSAGAPATDETIPADCYSAELT